MNIKSILALALPIIIMAETMLANLDSNTTGKDDKAARFLGYCRKGLSAIVNDEPLPEIPQELKS